MQELGSTRLQHTRPRREYDERLQLQSWREEDLMTLEMAKTGVILNLETQDMYEARGKIPILSRHPGVLSLAENRELWRPETNVVHANDLKYENSVCKELKKSG